MKYFTIIAHVKTPLHHTLTNLDLYQLIQCQEALLRSRDVLCAASRIISLYPMHF